MALASIASVVLWVLGYSRSYGDGASLHTYIIKAERVYDAFNWTLKTISDALIGRQ